MAWTDLTFAFGSLLTSAKMTQLFDNLAALANQDSGAPTLYWNVGWIQLDGTGTISITGSHNVSGIVDDGTGQTTISWDTDFADATYSAVATSASAGTQIEAIAAGTLQVQTINSGGGANDAALVFVIATGDQ